MAAWARVAGIAWEELPQNGVVRRLKGRDGWQARRDDFMAQPALSAPRALDPVPGVEPGLIPTPQALRLASDRCPHRQTGGRVQGLALLESFLTGRGAGYRSAMSSPVSGERACSRLSPHLAMGTLSLREVEWASKDGAVARAGANWGKALASFQARLAWRDHFAQKLEDAPSIETDCLHPAAESLRPRIPDPTRIAAWANAETGVPFVDACMRYLQATGWLNFRMRAMLVSFASYHLWLDWRATGPVLARRFTDYDPGIHWPQMQMQSGTTGINTVRIYNPIKQGQEQDPTGSFTRTWVPELATVPDAYLQTPWSWPGAQQLDYPAPMVDPSAAARLARQEVWSQREGHGYKAVAKAIADRHGSRADPARRFVNDRAEAPRRRTPPVPDTQLRLDL